MDRTLVTGGCGFIGSNFVRMLLAKADIEVVNLDLLTYAGNKNNLKGVDGAKNYSFIKGDIADKKTVKKALDGVDTVFNFAAESHVDNSIKDAGAFVHTNVEGTRNIAQCAMDVGVKRLVQIGTDEVYGSVEEGSSKETDRLEPRNPYSACKAASDLLALSFNTTFGFDVVVTRSSNNYGPYQYPEKAIPLFITNLIEGQKVPLYGDGKNVRDWLHVEDNCTGIITAAQKGKPGNIYNIGGGNEVQNVDLTHKILSLLGKGEEMILHVEDRKGHDRRYSLDCSKMRALGWEPRKKFGVGLRETVDWYAKNEWWWKPLKKKQAMQAKGGKK